MRCADILTQNIHKTIFRCESISIDSIHFCQLIQDKLYTSCGISPLLSIKYLAFCHQFVLRSLGPTAISPVEEEDQETGEERDDHDDDDDHRSPRAGAAGALFAGHGGCGGVLRHRRLAGYLVREDYDVITVTSWSMRFHPKAD